jgi:proteasome lid subunit RPN8/RPN11
MPRDLILSRSAINELFALTKVARGLEVAGLLLENAAGEQRIQRAPNLHSEPGNIEIPRWWIDRMLVRQSPPGFRPVAFFHSHVSSLELSETDRASLDNFPLPWIVLMVKDGQLEWVVKHSDGCRAK